jgi:hypothetical protein
MHRGPDIPLPPPPSKTFAALKSFLRLLIFVACVVFSVAGVYNVLSDNIEVVRMATAVACAGEGPKCDGRMTRMERNPIAQSFEIVTPKKKVDVRCTRSFYLLGEYSCALR